MLAGDTDITPTELADLVVNLPPGCALWRATGGPMAWTDETHVLVGLLHRLDVLAWQNTAVMQRKPRGKAPKPIEPPPFAHEQAVTEQRAASKRDRYLERRAARSADQDT
ncbi:hypothetical protein [Isoptericola sp. NPDC056134]|uniref:hypothetical protein n=1 Tax=Isoptericola sp. NPDC056134 TaxID=3345723 RepID=UPI0035F0EC38